MMIRPAIASVAMLAALTVPLAAQPPDRPTVAVLDFDYAAVREQWSVPSYAGRGRPAMKPIVDTLNVGRGIADLLVDELVGRGDVRVIERKRLGEVRLERQYARPAIEGAAPTGLEPPDRLLGARYLIVGSITRFGSEEKTRGGFLGILAALFGKPLLSPALGAITVKKTSAQVALSCRLVDVTTSEVLGSVTAGGTSKRKGLALRGFASGPRFAGAGGLNVHSSDFQATILGEATSAAVKNVATKLEAVIARTESQREGPR